MLRTISRRLLHQGRSIATSSGLRAEEGLAAPAGAKEFLEAWKKSAPSTMNVPELPGQFVEPEAAADPHVATDGEKFGVNFYTPHGIVAEDKVGRSGWAGRRAGLSTAPRNGRVVKSRPTVKVVAGRQAQRLVCKEPSLH